MALDDLSRERATLAENEVTSLKEQLGSPSSGSSSSGIMAPPPSDREEPLISNPQHKTLDLSAKDKEISNLMEDVQRLQTSLHRIRENSAEQVRRLEEQLDKKQEVISRLEARLESQKDYDEMQRQLLVLKGHSGTDNFMALNGTSLKDKQSREELVATWRRSLERSLLSSASPPPLPSGGGGTLLPHGTESSSPQPQQSPPTDSSLHDSCTNPDTMSLLNGTNSASHDRVPFRFEDSLIPKSDPMEARLQEMLRYNMDKFGSQCLDTLQIARRVRELLSIHNIGQRLFAKYVLGLSQGTVSELLSKPKPWDKLTEKGRDSYRKMHAWAADDASVLLLKSLIPKKGKECSSGLTSLRNEESGAEDRIASILSEANHALHRNQQQLGIGYDPSYDDHGGSKSPSSNNNGYSNNGQGPPSPSSSSSRDRRLRKYENDDISQEQVARIYQEELAKLVGIRLTHHGQSDADARLPRENFQSLLFPHLFGGSLLERDDIRMALDAYHRELAKLANSSPTPSSPPHFRPVLFQPNPSLPNGLSGAQDLSLPKRLSPEIKAEDKSESDEQNEVLRHIGSAFSLVKPKGGESPSPLNSILAPSGTDDSCNASPLQRMASITNSLISQPATPSVSSPSQRPLKAVLPPITQQQFDQYNNLNTEDIVRKVKEQLSQYSISQRLFGESVLGLSQGSVSDLLARPKPWHMLTQKGREPFIRMKMFLEDENAVHKLVASQYKIAPEKLMRTGGYSGNPSPAPPTKAPSKAPEVTKSIEVSPTPVHPLPSLIPSPQSSLPLNHEIIKKSPCSQGSTTSPVLNVRSNQGCLNQQPSVYEMAALTQDMDTQLITTKIKEALLANNIGQKIFGEVVLGLSQGSVSELLSKPKPWHMLSIKGREPFIRMQLWLADHLNVERLQHLKNERREANKRKRGMNHGTSNMDSYTSGNPGSSDASNDSPNESYSPGSGIAAPPNKKQRVLFTDEQKEALRLAFALDPYPNVSAIEFLGRELGLSSRTITNWFHNHRMRLKQQNSTTLVQDSPLSSQPFDPVQFRLLLHQRLLEVHKDKYAIFPFLGLQNKSLIEEGLDLTVSNTASRVQSDNEDEYFDDVESTDSGDSGTSIGSKDVRRKNERLGGSELSPEPQSLSKSNSGNTSGSSRRKPVAPQWLNPSWHDDSEDEEILINGVCVVQNSLSYEKSGSKKDSADKPSSGHHGMKVNVRSKCREEISKILRPAVAQIIGGRRSIDQRTSGDMGKMQLCQGVGRNKMEGVEDMMIREDADYPSDIEDSSE